MSEFVPESAPSKKSFLFGPGEQILDQIATICSQQDKFKDDTKLFLLPFQNNFGTFALSFLTLVVKRDIWAH